jgi:hypothetical protein
MTWGTAKHNSKQTRLLDIFQAGGPGRGRDHQRLGVAVDQARQRARARWQVAGNLFKEINLNRGAPLANTEA